MLSFSFVLVVERSLSESYSWSLAIFNLCWFYVQQEDSHLSSLRAWTGWKPAATSCQVLMTARPGCFASSLSQRSRSSPAAHSWRQSDPSSPLSKRNPISLIQMFVSSRFSSGSGWNRSCCCISLRWPSCEEFVALGCIVLIGLWFTASKPRQSFVLFLICFSAFLL